MSPVSRKLPDRLVRITFYCAYRAHLVWNYLIRPSHHGVWIAVWSGGKLLLVRNSYRNCITLPGGGQDRGESLVEAALRELREEVGIQAGPGELTPWGQYLSLVEYKSDHINLFELSLDTRPEVVLDHREVIWSAFCSPARALEMNLFPALRSYLEDKQAGRCLSIQGAGSVAQAESAGAGCSDPPPRDPVSVGAPPQQNRRSGSRE